jgi:hypothetical protein
MERQVIPLHQRKGDAIVIAFFALNLAFVTYIVDFETLVVADPANFTYPLWPPAPLVDLIHWYGRTFDPLLLARPPFWKATIWIDALLFGPFYVVAIHAYWKGRDWIRLPSIIYATMLFTNVVMILSEEAFGVHAAPSFAAVLGFNLLWLLMPFWIVARMWPSEHPFTREPGAGGR